MRFGILSTAAIALDSFVPGVAGTDHEVTALASRDGERAARAAAEHGIPTSYEGYEALFDADIDAVYNPLPNGLHATWTKRAADAGLDVLCEKPLACDADEAREVVEHCADADVTLMEAFMYRYHPRTERVGDLLAEMGEVVSAAASFGFALPRDPADIRLNPDLCGGSLMDVGCYPVDALRTFLGEPDRVLVSTHDSRDCGVDTRLTGQFVYDDGASATLRCWFDAPEHQRYRIETTDGWLDVDAAFGLPNDTAARLHYRIGDREAVETFDPVDQYALEADHFAECVATGATPRTDGAAAIRNLAVIDALTAAAESGGAVEPADRSASATS